MKVSNKWYASKLLLLYVCVCVLQSNIANLFSKLSLVLVAL